MIPSVVKRATQEPERTQLRHEAEVLLRARHPGVIPVASFTDDSGVTCLALAPVRGSTLAEAPPKHPLDALRFTAALARTLADLHAIGVAHRALRADRVLSTDDLRPMLCEFGDATAEADDDDRRVDAEALRDIVELIALAVTPEARGSRAARAIRSLATDLRDRAEPMAPEDVAARAGRAAARHARTRRRRSGEPRRHRVLALTLGPMIVVGTLVVLSRHAGEPGEPGAALGPAGADDATHPSSTTAVGGTAADAPRRIEAGGAVFEVGRTGDDVLIADWHCDGEPSAAVVRPTTGEVFLFSTLPHAGETLTSRHVATVPGAVSIIGEHTASCPPLLVRRTDGTTVRIEDR